MKASASPRTLYAVIFAALAVTSSVHAQDRVVQKGQPAPRDGVISALVDGKIKIKVGPVDTTIPMDQVIDNSFADQAVKDAENVKAPQ